MNYIEIGDERRKQNFTMMSLSAELLTNPKTAGYMKDPAFV